MHRLAFYLGLCIFYCYPSLCFAQQDTLPSFFQYLQAEPDLPHLILQTDLTYLQEHKAQEDYLPGKLILQTQTDTTVWTLKVSPRGRSRKIICDMPPLRFKLSKKQLTEANLNPIQSYKLISYCKDKSRYERYLLREFLAYQLLNIVTDYSYRTLLVRLDYQDQGQEGTIASIDRYGILIENKKELWNRMDCRELKRYDYSRDSVDQFHYDVLALFQFMISNTDWDLGLLHNLKLLEHLPSQKLLPLAYDFDYSGLVNAEYAIPNPDHDQITVRQRLYIGHFPDLDSLQPAINHFLDKKEWILGRCQTYPYLEEKERKKIVKYLKRFFTILEKGKLKKYVLRKG